MMIFDGAFFPSKIRDLELESRFSPTRLGDELLVRSLE
jgi:hypothetical protein